MICENIFDYSNILITGGAGFIGSNLAHYFDKYYKNARVVVFDKFRDDSTFPNGNPTSLGHFKNLLDFGGEIIAGDLNNPADLERLGDIKWNFIFHQAAISDTTQTNQEIIMRTNLNSFRVLLNLAHKTEAKMIYASSAATYGNSLAPNCVGSGEMPENVYGFSKLGMDKLTQSILAKDEGGKIVGLRYFNVFGKRESFKGKTASMILQLGIQAIKNKKVRLFKHGEQKRDFVYIDDVVAANICAASANCNGVFNVGSGVARSFNDIVSILKTHLGDFEVEYFDNPYSFYQAHTQADISQTQAKLNYIPKFSLEDGIKEYIGEITQIAKDS